MLSRANPRLKLKLVDVERPSITNLSPVGCSMSQNERLSENPEVFDAKKSQAFLKKVGRVAARIPFARNALAMYYALIDSEIPMSQKAPIVGALAYFVLPFDLIPDFIVGVGFADDAAVIATAFKAVQMIISDKHYAKADEFLAQLRAAE